MFLFDGLLRSHKNFQATGNNQGKGNFLPHTGINLFLVIMVVLSIGLSSLLAPSSAQAETFASPAFQRTWARPDLPVLQQAVHRSFVYGAEPFFNTYEPYAESPNGQRLVQYFDKTRMEITQPGNDPNNLYYVTNGLLVKEMVLGNLQLGDKTFQTRYPAYGIPIAGDQVNNDAAPTYASFTDVASTQVNREQVPRIGLPVDQTIDRTGQISNNAALGALTTYAFFEPTLKHNIAKPFWDFMNQRGIVIENGAPLLGPVVNWVYTIGYPITDAYWTVVNTAGQRRDVLVQLFERRVLTWTPANPADFQVEMGNVGRHYYQWRYDPKYDVNVTPSSQATINPSAGFPGVKFVIRSQTFIPNEPIVVAVTEPSGKVTANFDTVSANIKGELLYVITTTPGATKGQYSLTFDGQISGNKSIVYFRLIGIPGITE